MYHSANPLVKLFEEKNGAGTKFFPNAAVLPSERLDSVSKWLEHRDETYEKHPRGPPQPFQYFRFQFRKHVPYVEAKENL